MPFTWSKNDCCTFVCDWIDLCCGVDPSRELKLRGTYDDARGAARVLKRHGGIEAVVERAWRRLGWSETTLPYARRGDIVSLKTDHGPALGICLGDSATFAGPHGLAFVPLAECLRAWRVG